MTMVERALEGYKICWANLLLVCMYEKSMHCTDGVGTSYFGSVLMSFFEHISCSWPLEVVEDIGPQVLVCNGGRH